ncbi:helix-turn-helix domain-containing protein [Clostridium botulinum]|uniref:helix-turn-helix domain-containing protein n=1 Tax=Clostridium botulinum TaxID=1491 RepID=UPI003EF9BE0B
MLRENCDFVGYMFLDSVNQTFEPCLSRICDILYLYLIKVQPNEDKIPLTQSELANLASASRAQMERSLKILREEQIIETARGYIKVLNGEKLFTHCTQGVHENI